jgi:hypothetical protein
LQGEIDSYKTKNNNRFFFVREISLVPFSECSTDPDDAPSQEANVYAAVTLHAEIVHCQARRHDERGVDQ